MSVSKYLIVGFFLKLCLRGGAHGTLRDRTKPYGNSKKPQNMLCWAAGPLQREARMNVFHVKLKHFGAAGKTQRSPKPTPREARIDVFCNANQLFGAAGHTPKAPTTHPTGGRGSMDNNFAYGKRPGRLRGAYGKTKGAAWVSCGAAFGRNPERGVTGPPLNVPGISREVHEFQKNDDDYSFYYYYF